MKNTWNKILTGAALGVLSVAFVALLTELLLPTIFESFEAKTLDWRYRTRIEKLWRDRKGAPIEDIVIVDIDNRSLDKLGPFHQWPRTYHAQLIDHITAGHALAIGFDILLLEPDKDPDVDAALASATFRSDIVYHAMSFSNADPDAFLLPMETPPEGFDVERFSLNLPDKTVSHFQNRDRMDGKILNLYNAATGIGFTNFAPDNDSVIRRMPLFLNFAGRQYLALSFAIVKGLLNLSAEHIDVVPGKSVVLTPPGAAPGETLEIPIDRAGRVLINYAGTFKTFRYVSYYDVLMQRVPAEMFEGKIVLVGTSAAGLLDIRPVPFQAAFPGVEIHANIIHNILAESYITRFGKVPSYLLLVLGAIAIALAAKHVRPWFSGPLALVISAGYVVLCFQLFAHNAIWLEMVRPTLVLLLTYLAVFVYRYVEEERNKRWIKGMFQYYVSVSVVDQLLKNPEMLKLGGERHIATAFFSDIQDFTTVSETLSPEQLISQLNEYLSAMTRIVFAYEGLLDKYEGDAIMALFGVPIPQDDHALRACHTALEMQDVLKLLREKWGGQGMPEFYVRIGINSGPMIAGNVGGEQRFDYTAIGDSVNLASRMEGANKTYDTHIMITEFTHKLLDGQLVTRELDFIRVKGKNKPVRVFEVVALKESELSEHKRRALERFAKGLSEYRQLRWDTAIKILREALDSDPEDGPSQAFLKRCEFFKEYPPPENWDGVFEMQTK